LVSAVVVSVAAVVVSVAAADCSVVDVALEQAARADPRRTKTRMMGAVFLFMIFSFFPISGWYDENGLVKHFIMVWFIALILDLAPVKMPKINCELPERIPLG
jgi:hypothetical protein